MWCNQLVSLLAGLLLDIPAAAAAAAATPSTASPAGSGSGGSHGEDARRQALTVHRLIRRRLQALPLALEQLQPPAADAAAAAEQSSPGADVASDVFCCQHRHNSQSAGKGSATWRPNEGGGGLGSEVHPQCGVRGAEGAERAHWPSLGDGMSKDGALPETCSQPLEVADHLGGRTVTAPEAVFSEATQGQMQSRSALRRQSCRLTTELDVRVQSTRQSRPMHLSLQASSQLVRACAVRRSGSKIVWHGPNRSRQCRRSQLLQSCCDVSCCLRCTGPCCDSSACLHVQWPMVALAAGVEGAGRGRAPRNAAGHPGAAVHGLPCAALCGAPAGGRAGRAGGGGSGAA